MDAAGRDYSLHAESPAVAAASDGSDMGAIQNTFSFAGNLDDLCLSELMYHPDDDGEAEFIEFWNAGDDWLDLGGVAISLGVQFTFPPETFLAPNEYLVVVRNAEAFTAKYGDGIRIAGTYLDALSNNGETLLIAAPPLATPLFEFTFGDGGQWPSRTDGVGSSLEPIDPAGDLDDPSNWSASISYGGSPGSAESLTAGKIAINELLAHHIDEPLEDAIELLNTTDAPIDIGGWFLSDNGGNLKKYRIPNGTILKPGRFLVLYEYDFNDMNTREPFALSRAGESACLTMASMTGTLLGFANSVVFDGSAPGVSFERYRTSVDVDFVAMETLTFTDPDSFYFPPPTVEIFRQGLGFLNPAPVIGNVLINEMMYHPPDLPGNVDNTGHEYIELYNASPSTLALSEKSTGAGWRLDGAIEYTFPLNVKLPPGGHLLVVGFDPHNDPAAMDSFENAFNLPENVMIYGPWTGKLSNSREEIRLYRPDAPLDDFTVPLILVDHVYYGDDSPWPDAPDGDGASLERKPGSLYGNEPLHWAPGPAGGTPGRKNLSHNPAGHWYLFG